MKSPSCSTRNRPIRTGLRAYRTAADTLRGLARPVHEIVAFDGSEALTELPGIGPSLARSLERLTKTGRLPLLEQLRGVYGPEEKIATVPGIGPKTAARIHQSLGISTLAELQAAAYDGRLAQVPGMGTKRLRAVRESLAGRFRRPARLVRAGRASSRTGFRRRALERRRRVPPKGRGGSSAADRTAAVQSRPQSLAADLTDAPWRP